MSLPFVLFISNQSHAPNILRDLHDDPASSVRTAVVDDDDLVLHAEIVHICACFRQGSFDSLLFIVCGDDDGHHFDGLLPFDPIEPPKSIVTGIKNSRDMRDAYFAILRSRVSPKVVLIVWSPSDTCTNKAPVSFSTSIGFSPPSSVTSQPG